ncbi:zinc-ribbon domain-containing protein [bacterium]|nr:zinc-ribbon domain-containing protein [bacterium]
MNKSCPQCGREIRREQKFCIYCGADLLKSQIRCSCGAELPIDALFCAVCGTRLNGLNPPKLALSGDTAPLKTASELDEARPKLKGLQAAFKDAEEKLKTLRAIEKQLAENIAREITASKSFQQTTPKKSYETERMDLAFLSQEIIKAREHRDSIVKKIKDLEERKKSSRMK